MSMYFGGGHAATVAVRATKKGFLKPEAIAAIAPTWAGPFPIGVCQEQICAHQRKMARYVPAAFRTGLLVPVGSREEFLELCVGQEGIVPGLVVSAKEAPKRSKSEMEALRRAKGVSKFVEVRGALLPQEEYPKVVADEQYKFLVEDFKSEA